MLISDYFGPDGYNVAELSAAIELLPHAPSTLGDMGLFEQEGVQTTTVQIEYSNGLLQLLPTAERGTLPSAGKNVQRRVRSFVVPHIPHLSTIKAEEIQNLRAFGSASELETVDSMIEKHLKQHKANHGATLEFHRVGAASGNILDADGVTSVYNLFTEFGLVQDAFSFNFSAGTEAALHAKCVEITDSIQSSLGNTSFTGVVAMTDTTFFNAMVASAGVRAAWQDWQNGEWRRQGYANGTTAFVWGGITWMRYRGSVGSVGFLGTTNIARFFPTGVPGLFKHFMAPANFMETVNTIGIETYVKQVPDPYGMGVNLLSQSNPLMMCVRPMALKRATST